jgi:PAS domain S-box-containing protein
VAQHQAERTASQTRLVVIVPGKTAGPPAQLHGPELSTDPPLVVADTVVDAVALLTGDAACDAVVVGPGVERPLDVARQVHLSRRTLPIILMVEAGEVQRFQQMLPFVPHLGDVWIAAADASSAALRRLIADAASAASRRRSMSSMLERINRQLMPASDLRDEAKQRRLAQSDRFLASLLAHAPDAILATDLNARIVAWNDAASTLFHRDADEAMGRPLTSLFAESFRENLAALLERTKAGEVVRTDEIQALLPDLTTRTAEVILAPVYGESGRVGNLSVIVRDITERVDAENRLRQSQKMEAIGHLTGGVAHDFNNLLTVVIGNLELLDRHLQRDRRARDLADQAMKAAERGATLVRQLLSFGRRQALRPTAVDLNELVATTLDLLRRTLGETIEIETRLAPALEPARVDRNQLESALLNLCLNARDAMPEGGRLTIQTTRRRVPEDFASEDLRPGDYAVLTVVDFGVGMSPEVQARAFEPFFTTKDVGEGSGLGLSMVYGFAKQSGGHVELSSEPGRGTTVTLFLPIMPSLPDPAAEEAEAEHRSVARATVLLVEDDPDVRSTVVAMLTDLGCQVLEAQDGPSALRILEGTTHIDLLFADVVMPGGISGPQLARHATALRPSLKVLLASGYNEIAAAHGDASHLGGELLTKPFRRADLALRIRRLLEDG